MPTSPPPNRRLLTASQANTETSDLYIPTMEQEEIDQNFSHPEWTEAFPPDFRWTEVFPPGVRFCPLDGELIVYYLQKKVNKESMPYNKIPDVNLYDHNPEYLAGQYQVLGDGIWYFFSPRDRKYRKGKRPKRAADNGYWKATGADKPVKHRGVVVGKKKALVFYLGKPPNGDKTDWIMQEYTVDAPPRIRKDEYDMRLDDWVLCKLYKKATGKSRKGGQDEGDQQIANTATSTEEEVAQGAKQGDNPIERNYSYTDNNYIQQPSQISTLPPLPNLSHYNDFPAYSLQQQVFNYNNFPAYPPQQQVVNYRDLLLRRIPGPPRVHSTQPGPPRVHHTQVHPTQPGPPRVHPTQPGPPRVHPTHGFLKPKHNIQENIGSFSTMDNLVAPQLPQPESTDPLAAYYDNLLLPKPSPP